MTMNRIQQSTADFALPSEASGTSQSASFDFALVAGGSRIDPVEFDVSWSLIEAADLPNEATVTLSVEQSADDSAWETLYPSIKVLTGATAGLAAGSCQFAVPHVSASRYIRVKATADDSVVDASGVSLTVTEYM